jgi:hypothetical protein
VEAWRCDVARPDGSTYGRNVPDWLLAQQQQYSATAPDQSRTRPRRKMQSGHKARRCATIGHRKGSLPRSPTLLR